MAERRTRRRAWLKYLLATGLLGGGGAGGYQYITPQEGPQASVDPATLDVVQESWTADAPDHAELPPAPPAAAPSFPPNDLPPAPMPGGSRYADSPLPLPLDALPQPTTRGQNPTDEYDLPAEPPINPLRAGVQPLDTPPGASQAFADDTHLAAPPAAVAAFADPTVTPVAAVQPLPIQPPPAMDEAPLDEVPLTALPQAAPAGVADAAPAPFSGESAAVLPPTPDHGSNPLRAQESDASPVVPEESYYEPRPMAAPGEERSALALPIEPQAPPTSDARPMQSFESAEPPAAAPPMQVGEGAGRPGDRSLEGQQQPSLAIQKFAPAEIQVGKPCKFQIKVRNNGQHTAHDVVVRDKTPAGARLTATEPQAQVQQGEVAWQIGALRPGEERTLQMELTPIEEGAIGSVARVTFSAEASVQTRCTRPQLALRMTAPSKVLVGQQQQIQIEIKNPGTGDATGVVILENVPENLRHAAGPTLEFEVGTLRPGETRRLQLNMVAESAGKVVNVLTAQADGNLHVDQKVEFEVVAPALEVAVDGPQQRYLERPAQYTVKIANPGTASARDLRLVTQLPRGMRFVNANNLGEYDASTHAVYWSLAELPAGESGAVQLTAVPVAAGEHKVQVKAETRDGLRQEAIHDTRVEGIAALKFTVTDLEDPIEVGGQTEYEIRVANQGTKAATNVVVRAATPAGMTVVSAAGDARHRLEAGAVSFEPIRQLPPGSELVFRLAVKGAQPGDHRLVVEVSSDDLTQPVRKEESTRVFGDS